MLKELTANLINCKVTNVIAGGSNGSIILIEFDSTYLLYVYCTWRLEQDEVIITDSNDSPHYLVGKLPNEIKKLKDDKVIKIYLSPYNDLQITFASSKTLNILCDRTNDAQEKTLIENWCLCEMKKNFCLSVRNNQEILKVEYKSE